MKQTIVFIDIPSSLEHEAMHDVKYVKYERVQ